MPVNDERGAVAVIVAVSLTALLGMGALVLDVGALFLERRELQNGADAAALAIAESCALGLPACTNGASVKTAAESYANANADDGMTKVDYATLNRPHREIEVRTSTKNADGNKVRFGFGAMFGMDGKRVTAEAAATWGPPGNLDVFRMTMSDCLFETLTDGSTVFDVEQTILFHDPVTELACTDSNNNQTAPGNWGWLGAPLLSGDRCIADVTIGVNTGSTGNNPECTAAQLDALIGEEFGIPVFESSTCCGSNVDYAVVGFAAFELTGYHLGGSLENNPPCGPPDTCISGTFTRFITQDEVLDPDAELFGVSVVRLTK